ncbi:MAG: SAM-dependent chlorinase/fluorinase [Bacteroidota bacterium]
MIVTLTTDFGLRDGYVAALKGVMLSIAPGLTLIDVSHEVAAQDVMEGAYVLGQALPYLPDDTVHLVVVDPGVGTDRMAIAARFTLGGCCHTFVGPDNGLLSLLCREAPPLDIVVLDRPEVWRTSTPSATFHGRDIFAPVAALLAAGASLRDVGTPMESVRAMHWPLPRYDAEGVDGWVVHIDRYGNCITNITTAEVQRQQRDATFKCYVGSTILHGLSRTYASVSPGDPLILTGSGGHLEIAVRGGNAAELLSVHRGDSVNLVFDPHHAGDGASRELVPATTGA